jgi:hypothetical protein
LTNWTQPGAWANCQNNTLLKFANIAPEGGLQTLSVPLDPAVIKSWVTNPASNNGRHMLGHVE